MVRNWLTTSIALLAVALTASTDASACVCKDRLHPDKSILQWAVTQASWADLIFEGALLSETSVADANRVKERSVYVFESTRTYKGPVKKKVEIYSVESTCGIRFSTDTTYLVFAYEDEGLMTTGLCTGTAPVERVGHTIRYLRKQKPIPSDFRTVKEFYLHPSWRKR